MSYNKIFEIINEPHRNITSIALIPGGKNRIVASTTSGSITLFETETGNVLVRKDREQEQSTINMVAWSPDGTKIASANEDGIIQIWNAENLQLLITIGADRLSINAVAWSPDSTRIVSGSDDGRSVIWNVADGLEVRTLGDSPADDADTEGPVLAVAWSPTGQNIVTSYSESGVYSWTVEIDPDEEESPSVVGLRGSDVITLAYNSDGTRIASGNLVGKIYSQDSDSGDNIIEMVGHTASVVSVVWSVDNSIIVSGSSDNTVRIWDAKTGKNSDVLRSGEKKITSVAISPDKNYIFASSADGNIIVWENTKVPARQIISRTIEKNIGTLRGLPVRPPGHFGPQDPGGKVYKKIMDKWNKKEITGGIKHITKTATKKNNKSKRKKCNRKTTYKIKLGNRKSKSLRKR